MASGDLVLDGMGESAASPLSQGQRTELRRVVRRARAISGYAFGVFVGPLPDGRESALAAHATLPTPRSAVLVAVDPSRRAIEIVTGSAVTVELDARACDLAAMAMRSAFDANDLVTGLRDGVTLLAEHARHPAVLHLDTPE